MLPGTSFVTLALALLALAAATVAAQARTEVRADATLRYGFGGDFAAHGFGTTGFIISEALFHPDRWSLPNDITMQGHPDHHWGDPLPQFRDLYLTGGSSRPRLIPRRSWWSERPDLWFRFSVPRCLQVTLYLLDASHEYPTYGPVNVRFDAGEPSERLFRVEDARSGVYLSFNMTVGSANMTIEKVNSRDEMGLIAAGVFFDELPAGSACELARPKTAPWTLHDGGATLLYNAGGDMSALGFGGRASWLPPPDQTSAALTPSTAAGYSIAVSRPYVIGSTYHPPSDDRTLIPPGAEARRSLNIAGNGGGDLTFTVTVPRCSLVRLYVVDLYDNIQEAEIRRPGLPTVRLSHGLLQGTWATFTQQTATAQYITNKVRGPNLPLFAVAVDDGPDDCVLVRAPTTPEPSANGDGSNTNNNANNGADGEGSNTVVIAVVSTLAVGAVCVAVAVGILLVARNHANNNRNNDDGGIEHTAEVAVVPVVGAVVSESAVQPEAPQGVLQYPDHHHHDDDRYCPPLSAYPPHSAHTPQHYGYPAQPPPQQSSYGPPAAAGEGKG